MNSSDVHMLSKKRQACVENRIVYAGNLGINRHLSIIKIAEVLENIDSSIRFEVYGRPTEAVVEAMQTSPNIKLMGFRSYQEITEVLKSSRLVIHTESFETFYRYDLEAAFSTKITDALGSGTPLFMYAPENLAETSYLIENDCAFVCTEDCTLDNCLRKALYDEEKRDAVVAKGRHIVLQNHDAEKNCQRMQELLQSLV